MEALTGRTILVIDDQIGVTGSLQQRGFLRNYERLPYTFVFETAWTGEEYSPELAVRAVEREAEVALVLLDLKFGEAEEPLGFEILGRLSTRWPSLPIVVMSSMERDVENLGRCLEGGAVGFIEKHRSPEYVRTAVERAIEMMQSYALLGRSRPLRELRRQAARLSPYDQIPVLVMGERGTGKERVARYIHQSGPRRQGVFVAVNCAGVPEPLFESEFFGSEKGAYTGASERRRGYLERAHGGTLFLDEVGTLPLPLQAKLLRVLQERTFNRLGSSGEELASSFQLVSATNADPLELVSTGLLREDFYDRIAAVVVRTPPLRECLDDLELLAEHFLRQIVPGRKAFEKTAVEKMLRYSWPGNVRELQRAVQEAVVRSEDRLTIETRDLPERIGREAEEEAPVELLTLPPGSASTEVDFHRQRILAELRIALDAKARIVRYKNRAWKAEFMRRVYPHCKAQSAKGFRDLIHRLTRGPWGEPGLEADPELRRLLRDLEE